MTGTDDSTPSEDRTDTAVGKWRPLVIRLLILLARIVVAAILLQAAITKLMSLPVTISMFESLGGAPVRYTVAMFEIAGAIGLLIPILSGVAAIGVSAMFVIIVSVQVNVFGPSVIGLAVVVLVLSLAISVLQRHQTVRLVTLLTRPFRSTPASG